MTAGGRPAAPSQVGQVSAFGVIEPQGPRDSVQDTVGGPGDVAPLQPGVVLEADPGQRGDLGAAQAGDPAAAVYTSRQGLPAGPRW
jgi:hypothetical protein